MDGEDNEELWQGGGAETERDGLPLEQDIILSVMGLMRDTTD